MAAFILYLSVAVALLSFRFASAHQVSKTVANTEFTDHFENQESFADTNIANIDSVNERTVANNHGLKQKKISNNQFVHQERVANTQSARQKHQTHRQSLHDEVNDHTRRSQSHVHELSTTKTKANGAHQSERHGAHPDQDMIPRSLVATNFKNQDGNFGLLNTSVDNLRKLGEANANARKKAANADEPEEEEAVVVLKSEITPDDSDSDGPATPVSNGFDQLDPGQGLVRSEAFGDIFLDPADTDSARQEAAKGYLNTDGVLVIEGTSHEEQIKRKGAPEGYLNSDGVFVMPGKNDDQVKRRAPREGYLNSDGVFVMPGKNDDEVKHRASESGSMPRESGSMPRDESGSMPRESGSMPRDESGSMPQNDVMKRIRNDIADYTGKLATRMNRVEKNMETMQTSMQHLLGDFEKHIDDRFTTMDRQLNNREDSQDQKIEKLAKQDDILAQDEAKRAADRQRETEAARRMGHPSDDTVSETSATQSRRQGARYIPIPPQLSSGNSRITRHQATADEEEEASERSYLKSLAIQRGHTQEDLDDDEDADDGDEDDDDVVPATAKSSSRRRSHHAVSGNVKKQLAVASKARNSVAGHSVLTDRNLVPNEGLLGRDVTGQDSPSGGIAAPTARWVAALVFLTMAAFQ